MTEGDIWSLTPAEATARLEAMKPSPPAATATNADQARARLDHLAKTDPEFSRKLLSGDVEAGREFRALTEMAANGDQGDRLDRIVNGTAETSLFETTTSGTITTNNAMKFASDLRE